MHSNMNTSPAGAPRIGKAERKHKVVVIKVGTSSLLRKGHLHLSMLGALAEACSDLSRAGCRVIVVTSGAVGAGCQVLGAVRAPQVPSTPWISRFHPPLAETARSPAAAPAAPPQKLPSSRFGKPKAKKAKPTFSSPPPFPKRAPRGELTTSSRTTFALHLCASPERTRTRAEKK